jgi:hypothetical protein
MFDIHTIGQSLEPFGAADPAARYWVIPELRGSSVGFQNGKQQPDR